MNKENLEHCNQLLGKLGFGTRSLLNQHLEMMMGRDLPNFELYTEAFFDAETKMEAKLYFVRKVRSDDYRFAKYDTLLRSAGDPQKDKRQTFYLHDEEGVSFHEAFNLLQGRSVYKQLNSHGEKPYNAWLTIDFNREKDENNNYAYIYVEEEEYDLQAELRRYPILEMKYDRIRASLLLSLHKGNVREVTFSQGEEDHKWAISANPVAKTLNVTHLRKIDR